MRIGLISDTHVPEAGADMPPQVYEAFKGVDLILHAGDMHIIDVLDWLETIAPVLGARGNGDYPTESNKNRPGVPDDPRVKVAQVIQIEDLKVGLIHGFPLPDDIPWRTPEEMQEFYFQSAVDVVVCGDTHEAASTGRAVCSLSTLAALPCPTSCSRWGQSGSWRYTDGRRRPLSCSWSDGAGPSKSLRFPNHPLPYSCGGERPSPSFP